MTDQLKNCLPCDGIQVITPRPVYNRLGLDALKYRIGTHSSFFESLLARISTLTAEELAELSLSVNQRVQQRRNRKAKSPSKTEHPLRDWLTTREKNDPAIAMLDAWSVVADVLTFYQERIANEGFLRTAQERRSIQELARLTGYRLRPGVSSTVYLAFEVEDTNTTIPFGNAPPTTQSSTPILIPKGTAVKSTPAPGTKEEPQTFETSRDFIARTDWNAIRPRLSRPQEITVKTARGLTELYFRGIGLRLQVNDYLAVLYDPTLDPVIYRIDAVEEKNASQLTWVRFRNPFSPKALTNEVRWAVERFDAGQMPAKTGTLVPRDQQPKEVNSILLKTAEGIILVIRELEQPPLKPNLRRVDSAFHEFVCKKLVDTNGQVRTIATSYKSTLQSFTNGLDTVQKKVDPTQFQPIGTAPTVRDQYQSSIANAVGDYEKEDIAVIQPIVALTNSNSLPTWIATVRAGALQLASMGEQNFPPAVVFACEPIERDVDGSAQKPLDKFDAIVRNDGQWPSSFKIRVRVVRGNTQTANLLSFEGNASHFTPNYNSGVLDLNPSDLPADAVTAAKEAIQSTKCLETRDVVVQLLDTSGTGPGVVIATDLQRTRAPSTPNPWQVVPASPMFFSRCSEDTLLALSLTAPQGDLVATTKYCIRATVFCPSVTEFGTLSLTSTEFTEIPDPAIAHGGRKSFAWAGLGDVLTTALGSIKYTASDSPQRVTILFELFQAATPPTVPNDCLATAISHVVVSNSDAISAPSGSFNPRVLPNALMEFEKLSLTPSPDPETWVSANLWDRSNSVTAGVKLYGPTGSLKVTAVPATKLSELAGTVATVMSELAQPQLQLPTFARQRITELTGQADSASINAANQLVQAKTRATSDANSLAPPTGDAILVEVRRRVDSLVTGLPNASQTNLEDDANKFEEAANDLKNSAADLTELGKWVDDLVLRIGDEISKELNDRRAAWIQSMNDSLRIPKQMPGGEPLLKTAVNNWIQTLENLQSRMEQLQPPQLTGHLSEAVCTRCAASTPSEICQSTNCVRLNCITGVVEQQLTGTALPLPSQPPSPAPALPKNLHDAIAAATPMTFQTALQQLEVDLNGWIATVGRSDNDSSGSATVLSSDSVVSSAATALNALFGTGNSAQRDRLLQEFLQFLKGNYDLIAQLERQLDPTKLGLLYDILRNVHVTSRIDLPEPQVFVFRGKANAFGWNAGLIVEDAPGAGAKPDGIKTRPPKLTDVVDAVEKETGKRLFLDGEFSKTTVDSFVAILKRQPEGAQLVELVPKAHKVGVVKVRPRTAYQVHNTSTELELTTPWWQPATEPPGTDKFEVLQSTRVFCDAERLILAEEPEPNAILPQQTFECSGLIPGLRIGSHVIAEGSVQANGVDLDSLRREVLEVILVSHEVNTGLFGDSVRTRLTLNRSLGFQYTRDSFRLYANVVESTHGETQREVLGSGDGAKEFQKFLLKRPEVSQIVTPNERGIQSTLVVKVNNVEWDEEESLREATEQQEAFVSQTNDAQQMSVVFGDGVNGARLPTGLENVRAEYRTGLGRKGNVAGGQINQLLGAPLGVKKVNNPLAAKGGADPESRELAREHAPLAVTAMDRLVSVQDYEDFARTYAGIGKASASMIQGTVHVTIAGLDPEPLDADNPIFSNLMHAFGIFGDPSQSFELHPREASLLIIVAKIKIDRRYEWQHVQPKIRTALLELFHYDRRDLGQDVLLSDAIATMQSIEGVSYVDVDRFDAVRQQDVSTLASRLGSIQRRPRVHVNLARLTSNAGERAALGINEVPETVPTSPATNPGDSANNKPADTPKLRPAELCYLTPDIPDTLILELIP